MARYRNKAPPYLNPTETTSQRVRMLKEGQIRLSNRRVSCVGGGEASNGKELREGEIQVKDNPVSEGDWRHPMLLRYFS